MSKTSDLDKFKGLWAIRTPGDLKRRSAEIGAGNYLIEGLLPSRTLGIVVGDSGLGKSPLLYQMGLCVAAGVPFLGRPVYKGRVLYFDYENGLGDTTELLDNLARCIGIETLPDDFLVWHFNDSAQLFGWPGGSGHTIFDMIRGVKPVLAIIDSFGAHDPEIEEKNARVTRAYQLLRRLMRDCGTTILGVHHIRKPSSKPEESPEALESGNLNRWFLQTRGPRALINGTDIRLGVDIARRTTSNEGAALVVRGFGRVRGEIGPLYLARELDEDGEPLGYRQLQGQQLLFNGDQESAFNKFPASFAFKEAMATYGRGDQATRDLLKKCERLGLVRQPARGRYEKLKGTE